MNIVYFRCARFAAGTAALVLAASLVTFDRQPVAAQGSITVGYLVKTLSNPFFVAMGDGAKSEAKAKSVQLVFEAGKYDGDNATQTSQIDDLITRGAKAIAVVPNLSSGLAPAVKRAKAAGIKVLSVDTALDPQSLADTFIATDNLKAGMLNGQWAKKAMGSTKPVVALLEGTPGSQVNTDRLNGFLQGLGIAKSAAVADEITNGDQGKGQTAMENVLSAHPNINLLWTVNEPAALGAATAIKARGLGGKIKVVSMDGGCRGIKAVQDGTIDSDVMQFPKKMAQTAIDLAQQAAQGKPIPKRVDTGEILVLKTPLAGISSQSIGFGLKNCW